MTECVYSSPLTTFSHGIKPEPWFYVDVMSKGKVALQEVNQKLGLAFDDWDLDYYTNIFRNQLKRNPTSVECFDLAQSNSEHSRHWFFKVSSNSRIPGPNECKTRVAFFLPNVNINIYNLKVKKCQISHVLGYKA
ncbi:hypothetical protein WDU94_011377 [Cyamophila willieti]